MARVVFTSHLQRHVSCPEKTVDGSTVREALDRVFADNEPLRGYIVDERHRLRKHVVIFIDGEVIRDRNGLSDPITDRSEVYVMQALSGG